MLASPGQRAPAAARMRRLRSATHRCRRRRRRTTRGRRPPVSESASSRQWSSTTPGSCGSGLLDDALWPAGSKPERCGIGVAPQSVLENDNGAGLRRRPCEAGTQAAQQQHKQPASGLRHRAARRLTAAIMGVLGSVYHPLAASTGKSGSLVPVQKVRLRLAGI